MNQHQPPPTPPFIAAAVQMTSTDCVASNLATAAELIAQAVDKNAQLVVLPEFFSLISGDETRKIKVAEADGAGAVQDFLATTAAQQQIHLIGGSIPLKNPADPTRVYSSCLLFAPNGERLCRYDKIHLFRFSGQDKQFDETQTITAGSKIVCVSTALGRIGLSICYDLRFPELYRAMPQPDIIVAPSAFIPVTGKAHWQLLLQARAVENQCHVIGAAQAGTHPHNRQTHGHSMIIDSWGQVLAHAAAPTPTVITAPIDPTTRAHHRHQLPALDNRIL